MIEVRNLTKRFGFRVAVSNASFHVHKGAILGLLGPNGAGKTTTLRMLGGVLGPTGGSVQICGWDIVASPIAARRCIGYLAENAPLYADMTGRQYLRYRWLLRGGSRHDTGPRVESACQRACCADAIDMPIANLSRGYRQRVGLADALLGNPQVLLLDEPSAGLDPNQVRELRQVVRQLSADCSIVVSTHVLAEVEAMCTHVLVMHQGRIIAHDALQALRTAQRAPRYKLIVRDPQHRLKNVLETLGWGPADSASEAQQDDGKEHDLAISVQPLREIEGSDDTAIERLVEALVKAQIGVRTVQRELASLETAFAEWTQSKPEGAA